MLSGLKDVDREILKHVDDNELIQACSTDRKTWNDVCDDNFLKRRLHKYPGLEKYKRENESWKQFFLRFIYYTSKMREDHQFEYSSGNFKKQYDLLEKRKESSNDLLIAAAGEGELPLVKHALKHGANIHIFNDTALRYASIKRHFEIVKFLIDNGTDIHISDELALRMASESGNLEMVKYLIERGAEVHASNDYSLRYAVANNDLQMVKYLVQHGANIHKLSNFLLDLARRKGYSDIVKYLESLK